MRRGGLSPLRVQIHLKFCSSSYRSRDIGKKLKSANVAQPNCVVWPQILNFSASKRMRRGGKNWVWKSTFTFYKIKCWIHSGPWILHSLKLLAFYFHRSTPIDAPLWVVMKKSWILSLSTSAWHHMPLLIIQKWPKFFWSLNPFSVVLFTPHFCHDINLESIFFTLTARQSLFKHWQTNLWVHFRLPRYFIHFPAKDSQNHVGPNVCLRAQSGPTDRWEIKWKTKL